MNLPYPYGVRESARHPVPWMVLAAVVGVLIWMRLALGPLRWEHWASNALLLLPAWLGGEWGHAWSWASMHFWVAGILYVNFKLIEPYGLDPVHVADLYGMEQRWFGVDTGRGRITLPEWFSVHNHAVMDLFAGLAYILYLYTAVRCVHLFSSPVRSGRSGWPARSCW